LQIHKIKNKINCNILTSKRDSEVGATLSPTGRSDPVDISMTKSTMSVSFLSSYFNFGEQKYVSMYFLSPANIE
jgi:hypothetical protein